MKCRFTFFFILITILLVGCTSQKVKPVDIKQNVDACDICNMGIQDLDSAAQLILKDGKPLLFDDIGCLIVYIQENQPNYEAAFVHDYESKEWISLDKSTFLQNQMIESPMSYGIAAFKLKDDAITFQSEHAGTIYTKDELIKQDIKGFKASRNDGHSH